MWYPGILITCCALLVSAVGCSDYFERYTDARVLKVREEPSLISKTVNKLPYGTKVSVKKTDKTGTFKKKKAFWYYSKDLNGYLFGNYLVEKEPEEGLHKMKLKYTWSGDDGPGGISFLSNYTLFNNRFNYSDAWGDESGGSYITIKGNYQFSDGRLLLNVDSCEQVNSEVDFEQNQTDTEVPCSDELYKDVALTYKYGYFVPEEGKAKYAIK